MSERPFTNEEVQMMNEINNSVQRLDFVDKAKTVGFIAGLASQAEKRLEMPESQAKQEQASL